MADEAGGRTYDAAIRVEGAALERFKAYCKANGLVLGFVASKLLNEWVDAQEAAQKPQGKRR